MHSYDEAIMAVVTIIAGVVLGVILGVWMIQQSWFEYFIYLIGGGALLAIFLRASYAFYNVFFRK